MATAIMTDNNPKFNVARPAKYFTLAQVLEDMSLKFDTIEGQYDNTAEKSLIVYGIDFDTLFALGQDYGQESVLYLSDKSNTWQIVYTNGANEGMAYVQTGITTSDVKPEDNFSFINGKYVQISFDFEKLVPVAA
jgi:hypothetical protein